MESDWSNEHILLYLRSSVTATPPFGDPFNFNSSLNLSTASGGIISAANLARFSRIWIGVRLEVGMSKYSPCFFHSCRMGQDELRGNHLHVVLKANRLTTRLNGQKCFGETRATCHRKNDKCRTGSIGVWEDMEEKLSQPMQLRG